MTRAYVHGHAAPERRRLRDQAATLSDLLHLDTHYPPGSIVLEAGCGVGAQTITLARRSPQAQFTAIDVSDDALASARAAIRRARLDNVIFRQADVFTLPFANGQFDHVFVCFVLEHLPDPAGALRALLRVLKVGGTLTVIEGDHGSATFHPASAPAGAAIHCLIDLQARAGGNALIGRQLYPLMTRAGLADVRVSPRPVYADASRPDLVEGFTKRTFTAMVAGVRQQAITAGLTTPDAFAAGLRGLARTARRDGTFCYTFYKGVGTKRQAPRRQPRRPSIERGHA